MKNINLSQITNSREDRIRIKNLISDWFIKTYLDDSYGQDFAKFRISSMSNEYVKNVNRGLVGSTWYDFEIWLKEYPKKELRRNIENVQN